jgi:hypothetical protein
MRSLSVAFGQNGTAVRGPLTNLVAITMLEVRRTDTDLGADQIYQEICQTQTLR